MKRYAITLFVLTFFLNSSCQYDQFSYAISSKKRPKKISKKEQRQKLTVKKTKLTGVATVFTSQEQKNKIECPAKNKRKYKAPGELQSSKDKKNGDIEANSACLAIRSDLIDFDVVYFDKSSLNIPTFKQFKNNMTDFTADGEKEFQAIISKIKVYLGDNTDGRGVTLKVWGSASQIPTSFDPSKPNNNISSEGQSIKGQTSIENNRLLAQERAKELAGKIKSVFNNITIVIPDLGGVQIGETQWTDSVQKKLDSAYLVGDRELMEQIFEPFQKEQFVKVESDEVFMKAVKPKRVKMYSMTASPKIVLGGESIRARFIISQGSFEFFSANNLMFKNEANRLKFLNKNGFKIKHMQFDGQDRWYIYRSKEELEVITNNQSYNRILASHQNDIVDRRDYDVLEEILVQQALKEKRFKYVAIHP